MAPTKQPPAGDRLECLDRRASTGDRRKTNDRRVQDERRLDSRLAPAKSPKTIKLWLRSLTHARLGVDRRKKVDRRKIQDRRQQRSEVLLTPEEIADLLS